MSRDAEHGGLHQCGQGRPLPTRPALVRKRDSRRPVIDVHCHYLNADVESMVDSYGRPVRENLTAAAASTLEYNQSLHRNLYWEKLTDITTRLADMDAMGIDLQLLSPSPTQYYYWAPDDLARDLVDAQNLRIASLCASNPDRFEGLGTVALQHPELAADQVRYAVKELGLRGVEISSTVNGTSVEDQKFASFWKEVDALGAMVLLHPLGTSSDPRMDEYYLANIVGQPLETTILLTRMILSGHFDRYERVRYCAVHGGGYLPFYPGRLDHGWLVRPEACGCLHRPSSYLRRVWFDSVVFEVPQLRAMINAVGFDRVVTGTDYPFDMGSYDPVGFIDQLHDLDDASKAAILGENALELIGITAPRSTARS